MLNQKSGKIINMSGTFGVSGGAEFTHMSAAKAGMIGFTRHSRARSGTTASM